MLANLYAPSRDDPDYFSECFEEIFKFSPDHSIIAGDFNLALDVTIDRKGTFCNNERAKKVNSIINAHDLIDLWRHFHLDAQEYTWRHLRPSPSFSRLDYMLANVELEQFVESVEIGYGFRTDHSPVVLTLSTDYCKRGPGYWKFNTSLLRDKNYVDKINTLLEMELA